MQRIEPRSTIATLALVIACSACGDDGQSISIDAAGSGDGTSVDGSVDSIADANGADAGPLTCRVLAGGTVTGFADGTGGETGTALFYEPQGIAVDSAGNAYVADFRNHRIRKVAPDGTTTTLAGSGQGGFRDSTAATTRFNHPFGVAVDGTGHVYVSDYQNCRIRKVAPNGSTTTLAGNGTCGDVDGTGGASGTAELQNPAFSSLDSGGNLLVIANNSVRKVAPDGSTTTVSGNGNFGYVDGTGGPGGTTEFNFSMENIGGIAIDPAGALLVSDAANYRIRKVATDGTTTTLAGNGSNQGSVDGTGGPAGTAQFNLPWATALDGSGQLYVVDYGTSQLRKVAPDGTTTTVANTCGLANIRGIAIADNVLYIVANSTRIYVATLP